MPRLRLSAFSPATSRLHTLSGPAKITSFLVLSLALLFLPFWFSLPFTLLLALLYALSGLSLADTLASHRFLVLFPLVAALFRYAGTGDWSLSLLNGLYLLDLLLLSLLFLAVTAPRQLREGLLYFKLPPTFALMFEIALQSLPLLQEKLQRIRIAQASRGSRRGLFPLLLPLLHGLFERARTLSISLESRGFEPGS